MRRRRPEVNVQHDDGDDDRQGDENHREQEILADERDDERCRRNDLSQEQEEDRQRQKYGNTKSYLLSAAADKNRLTKNQRRILITITMHLRVDASVVLEVVSF